MNNQKRPKILIVDDEEKNLKRLMTPSDILPETGSL